MLDGADAVGDDQYCAIAPELRESVDHVVALEYDESAGCSRVVDAQAEPPAETDAAA